MNQRMLRTLIFVGTAAVCLAGAIATSIATRPVKLDDTALVGQEFFPEFTDPTKATGLRVAAYDKDAAKVNLFNVEFKDGLWRIPSHHNYPADGEDQLAKTAASVVGIERGLYAGKTPEEHKRLGVLDPLDESITGTEGRGSRITLFQAGKPLVDLIIGNKAEESGNIYFVRKADDTRVYRAELTGLKISTKFAEWIEPDLLKIDPARLVQMVIDRYQIDEQKGSLVQGEISVLTKDTKSTPAAWQLEGLDTATEKVKTTTVNQMTSSLDNLKIVGVRQKPAGLAAVLTGAEGAALNQIEQIQMQRAGYFLTPEGQLVSNEGEILAGTNEGVRYTLRFGEVLSGTDVEIEVGSDADSTAETAAADATSDAGTEAPDDASGNPADDASVQTNRYVFITASFDESLLGERPAAPVKPAPPSEQPAATPAAETGATPEVIPDGGAAAADDEVDPLDAAAEEAEAEETAAADTADPAATAADQPATDPATEPGAASDPAAATEPAAATSEPAAGTEAAQPAAEPTPQEVYEAAQKQYEQELADYETRNSEFDKKVESGAKLAKELNERFAPWYYVISADLFAKLKVDRSELVEPATPAPTTGAGGPGAAPPSLPFSIPSSPEADGPADETGAAPAGDSPADAPAESGAEAAPEVEAAPADGTPSGGSGEPAGTDPAAPAEAAADPAGDAAATDSTPEK